MDAKKARESSFDDAREPVPGLRAYLVVDDAVGHQPWKVQGGRVKIMEWLKDKLDARFSLSNGVPELVPPEYPEEEEEEDVAPPPPAPSYRFKVTTTEEPKRVLFVYASDEAEARSKLPNWPALIANIEPAGRIENGVIHFPPEELHEVMKTMQDGRRAPGA